MLKRILLTFPVGVVLISCGMSTPNDVTIATTPGVCVTSQYPGYESNASVYYPYNAFPMNAYMPESSPYCMSVTLTNNNAGENSNNIQVYQGGLSLTYTVESVSYTSFLIDFNAAGLSQSSFTYTPVQQVGNIALFDPHNCVTTIGSNVNTISKNGGNCTFYLQLVSESMPVGDYPLNVSVNYTNGNDNYNVQTNVYYHASLYAGGSFTKPSPNVAYFNANAQNTALPLVSANITNPVQLMTRDGIGNIYAYDGSDMYVFNGVSVYQTPTPPSNINQISGDTFGNVFAATNNGLYVYNASLGSAATWSQVSGISGMVNAIQSESINQQNILYYTGANGVESCTYSANNCSSITNLFAGSGFNNGAIGYNTLNNQIAWASGSNVYYNSLTPLAVTTGTFSESGMLGVDPLGIVYAANNSGSSSFAVYTNVANSGQLAPLMDNANNNLTGVSSGVQLRNYTVGTTTSLTLYSYGNNLTSSNLSFSGAYLVYLYMVANTSYYASANWTPITGFDAPVNAVVVGSRLSNN